MHAAARKIVKLYALLFWIGALLNLFISFTLFTSGTPGSAVALAAYLAILLAVVLAYIGIGLWKLKPWARICTIIISILGILTVFFVMKNPILIVNVLIGIYGFWFFTFVPAVKELFAGTAPATAPTTAPGTPATPTTPATPPPAASTSAAAPTLESSAPEIVTITNAAPAKKTTKRVVKKTPKTKPAKKVVKKKKK